MEPAWIGAIIVRELGTLKRELLAYPDEQEIWSQPPGIQNSAGTLALHLCGNLRHYIGARLAATGYGRDRAAEFARRHVPRSELVAEIDATIAVVNSALRGPAAPDMEGMFPEVVGGTRARTGDFLLHLVSHLSYHVGQVDYHRRVVTRQPASVGAVAIAELATATT